MYGKYVIKRTVSLSKISYISVIASVVMLVILGVMYPILSIGAMGICIIYMLMESNENALCLMFFLLPFANIFKLGANSTSMYTYLSLVLSLKFLFSLKKIDQKFFFFWMLLIIIQIVGCRSEVTLLIKQIEIPILIYGFCNVCTKITKGLTINLMLGIICSCTVALFSDKLPGLSSYLRVVKAYELGIDNHRFTGLYTDPNYLTVAIILVCISMITLINQKKIGKIGYVGCGLLLYFGMLTISKSFFLMLFVVYILFLKQLFKKKKYFSSVVLLIALLIVFILMLNGKISIFDSFINRLMYSDDITTGRSTIWMIYIKYIIKHPINMIFGNGIGAESLGYLAHNTYIDFIYYYGIIGTVLFLAIIKRSVKFQAASKKVDNFGPAICFGMLSFFLSNLIMYDFPFMIIFVLNHLRESDIGSTVKEM